MTGGLQFILSEGADALAFYGKPDQLEIQARIGATWRSVPFANAGFPPKREHIETARRILSAEASQANCDAGHIHRICDDLLRGCCA